MTDPTTRAGDFEELVAESRRIKESVVDPPLHWYRTHRLFPFIAFRGFGSLTILCSVLLPALAVANFEHKTLTLSALSLTVAALTGLSSFYRWERTWRGRAVTRDTLEQLIAKWELEIANARLVLPEAEKMRHVYLATDDLLANVRTALSSESEGFFSSLQFPASDRTSKPKSPE